MMTLLPVDAAGYVRLYHTPFDSFWCCTGSGIENHARYGETIYARDDDTLFVNLFIASTLDWRERGLTRHAGDALPGRGHHAARLHSGEAAEAHARDPPAGVVPGDDRHA